MAIYLGDYTLGKRDTQTFQEVLGIGSELAVIPKHPKCYHKPLMNADLAILVNSGFKHPGIPTWQVE